MNIEKILSIILSSVTVIITTVLSVVTSLKSRKLTFEDILTYIPQYINEAERLFPTLQNFKQGEAKFNFVKNKVQIECLKAHIAYDDTKVTNTIENYLTTPQRKIINE